MTIRNSSADRLPFTPYSLLAVLLVGLLATAISVAPVQAQQSVKRVAIPNGYTLAQHIIRPGDTFITVTKEYLGSAKLWPINMELNSLNKERRLKPGERLTVLLDPKRLPLVARVRKRSGTVEANATPLGWLGAETNDLLIERDAARTKRNSSTELQFHDGTSVVVTEESLVFIRQLGRGLPTSASHPTTQRVEIVEGQADLSSLAGANASRDDVEVVLGSSTLRLPKESPIKTRTAIADSGASKVGVYEGAASFEAASGVTLDLERGEGLVAIGATAPKKEKLVEAPSQLLPSSGAQLVSDRLPDVTWKMPSDEAASYTLEVCQDAICGKLVHRWTRLTSNSHELPKLTAGRYFWRVTAASASGLDGYPSSSRSFQVVDLPPDNTPPVVALSIDGFGVPYDGLQAFGPSIPLALSVSDEGTGIERSGLVVNGKEQHRSALLATGRTDLSVFAIDRAGQRSVSDPVEVFIDADLPQLTVTTRESPNLAPPTVPRPRSQRRLRRAKARGTTFPAKAVFAVHADEPIGYSLDSIEWRPLAALETGLLTDTSELQLVVNDGFCLTPFPNQKSSGADGVCGRSFLTLRATDKHTGVKILSANLMDGELVIEAVDEVGNIAELRYEVVSD